MLRLNVVTKRDTGCLLSVSSRLLALVSDIVSPELPTREVELATREVELATREVELHRLEVELHTREVELRTVEVELRTMILDPRKVSVKRDFSDPVCGLKS